MKIEYEISVLTTILLNGDRYILTYDNVADALDAVRVHREQGILNYIEQDSICSSIIKEA